jgi:hypothetical protein
MRPWHRVTYDDGRAFPESFFRHNLSIFEVSRGRTEESSGINGLKSQMVNFDSS